MAIEGIARTDVLGERPYQLVDVVREIRPNLLGRPIVQDGAAPGLPIVMEQAVARNPASFHDLRELERGWMSGALRAVG